MEVVEVKLDEITEESQDAANNSFKKQTKSFGA